VAVNVSRTALWMGSQSNNIANLFADSYADLYTRVGFCEAEMADLKYEIGDMVSKDEFNEHCIVTVKDVIEAVSRLKFGIHDGHSSLQQLSCL
jgi:hypothetical protein